MERIIEQPNALCPQLRFLVVASGVRAEVIPTYKGQRLSGHITTNKQVAITKVLGFGDTLEKAQRMAVKKTLV
jgi:hypothetical protein